MKQMVFLLEEPSAKEMLMGVLPKLVGNIQVRYIVFEGKQDMEKRLEMKLRGWRLPDTCFIVMRDQDSGNCLDIKQTLQRKIDASGKGGVTLVRIACRELESFYLGDLSAVERGLNISGLARKQNNRKYRQPDNLGNASEELARLTKYRYQKLAGTRAIAPYLNISHQSHSHSFNILLEGIEKMIQEFMDK